MKNSCEYYREKIEAEIASPYSLQIKILNPKKFNNTNKIFIQFYTDIKQSTLLAT